MAMNIQLQYYAILREQRGCDRETLQTAAKSPAQLYAELQQRFNFTLPFQNLRVAINGEFQSGDAPLSDGDSVVFIPPVAGG
jgi:molybdopterin converting factor subunit 1